MFRSAKFRLLVGFATIILMGLLTQPVWSQTCTISNWDSHPGLDENSVGKPTDDISRYSGPCALQVAFGSDGAWVENTSAGTLPLNESSYIARFFVFVENLTGSDVYIFEAFDGTEAGADSVFGIAYSSVGGPAFRVDPGTGALSDPISALAGWNSIELEYDANAEEITVWINDGDAVKLPASDRSVQMVRLGDVEGNGSGSSFFDDFDSRRVNRPSQGTEPNAARIPGDATGDGVINVFDVTALRNEILGNFDAPDSTWPVGQPDCNLDGAVNVFDVTCVRRIILELD